MIERYNDIGDQQTPADDGKKPLLPGMKQETKPLLPGMEQTSKKKDSGLNWLQVTQSSSNRPSLSENEIDDPVKNALQPYREERQKALQNAYTVHSIVGEKSIDEANKDLNNAIVQSQKIFPHTKDAKNYLLQQIDKNGGKLPDKNETVQLAAQKVNNRAFIDRLGANSASIEDMAGKYFGKNFNQLPEAEQGTYLNEFLNLPEVKEKADEGGRFLHDYNLAHGSLYGKYPSFALKEIGQKIGQKLEDARLTGWLYSNPDEKTTDKAVKMLEDEGNLTPQEKLIYLNTIRPAAARGDVHKYIATTDVLHQAGYGLYQGAKGFEASGRDILNKLGGGFIDPNGNSIFQNLGLMQKNQERTQEQEQQQFAQPTVEAKRFLTKYIGGAANFAGQFAPMILGHAIGIPSELNAVMQFEGNRADEARQMFKGDAGKQNLYTLLGTTMDAFLMKAIPEGAGKEIQGMVKSDINNIVTKLANKEITEDAAKKIFLSNIPKYLSKLGIENTKTAGILSAYELANNGLNSAFGQRDFKAEDQLKGVVDNFKTNFFLGTFMNALAAKAGLPDKVSGKVYREASENPNEYISAIKSNNNLSDAQKQEAINNVNHLANVVAVLKEGNLSEQQQEQYLTSSLKNKVASEKLKTIPDKQLQEPIKKQIEKTELQQNAILNGQNPEEVKTDDEIKLERLEKDKEFDDKDFAAKRKTLDGRTPEDKPKIERLEEDKKRSDEDFERDKAKLQPTEISKPIELSPKLPGEEGYQKLELPNENKTNEVQQSPENKVNPVTEANQDKQGASEIKPQSEKISPNGSYKTAQFGSMEGQPMSDANRARQKEWMQDGNITMSGKKGDGETAKEFVGRTISEWEKTKKDEQNNTTVVTHSSVLKSIKAWEEMKDKPEDPNNFNEKQWKEFSDKFNKESTENGDLETFKGSNGDIHVIRHGETEDNKENKFRSGNTNLTDKGEKQAQEVGQQLKEKTNGEVPKIISSDLPRAIHTSNIIDEQLGGKEEKPEDVTSIKNETTRLRREQFGLDEEIPSAKKEFGTTLQEAKDKIENGYDPQDLVDELAKKPRPLTDVENAILLHHQNTKELQLIDANNKINEAAEKGDDQTKEEFKVKKARLLDELQKLYDVNKAVGTENARGLASRQMMIDRKYSLANMMAEKRATANDGKPLSEEQQKQVETLHKKIHETQEAFDNYIKEAEAEIKSLQEKILGKGVKDKKTAAQKLRELADKVEKSQFGKAKIQGGTQIQGASVDINKMVADAMRLVATGIEKGEKVLDVIKDAIEKIKERFPDIDEKDLAKRINREVINSGIINTKGSEKEVKKLKDYSGMMTGVLFDRKALELKADEERAKNEANIQLKKDELKKRSGLAKAQDVFVKWQRQFKLSNPLTIGKLMSAGFTRLTTTPLEDLVGGGYSLVMPKLAKGAIGEGGGLNVNETAKAYKNGMLEGIKDAFKIMKRGSQGKSNLDTVFGKLGELPPEAIDFFGQLHSATKAPFKRFAFERSLQRRLRRNIANGVDVSDPLVQTEILVGAYKDANRAIFMQDNKIATGWQNMVKYLDTHGAKPAATAMQWMLPFVKIPTNIASEIGTHVYGTPVAAGKLLHAAFTKGTENLSADEKDIIFRNLKKGTLGLAALTLGYMNPNTFGGFYQPGQKRRSDDAEPLGVKLFGMKIPAWFVESPIFQVMQLGATVRRVKDAKVKGEEGGIMNGVMAGALGLADRVPLVDQPMRLGNAMFGNDRDKKYYFGQLAQSTIDPALITYLAKVTDPADENSTASKIIAPENKRSPQSTLDYIKAGIPGLREQVQEKKENYSDKQKQDPRVSWIYKDWKMELPNTVASSEDITDEDKRLEDKLSKELPQVQQKYKNAHDENLFNVLGDVKSNGVVYVKMYHDKDGNPKPHVKIFKPNDNDFEEKPLNKLSDAEKAQVLRLAQDEATKQTKKDMFNE